MANFMKAFEDQRDDYLTHYGKKGMRWGVITSEYEPVGNQPGQQQDSPSNPEYSQPDQESMQQSADAVRQADAESVKDKRKRIVKNIVKGVAIGAIVAGIAAKGYAEKKNPGIIGDTLNKAKTTFSNLTRSKAGSTKAGENLRQKVAAASEDSRWTGPNTMNVGGIEYKFLGRDRRRAL